MKLFIVLAAVVVVLLVCAIVWIGSPKGPPLAQVAHLKTPRIVSMAPQKVLLVTARGDPNTAGKKAFGLLMGAYFKLKGVPRGGPAFKPPRARWALGADIPPDQWIGRYAMPVPENITEIPPGISRDGLTVELAVWEYGDVAEVLHVGPYAKETPTIRELKAFIDRKGCEIAGEHEEEYLRGPGMIFAGNPETYLTMIRYPIRRKPAAEDTARAGGVQ